MSENLNPNQFANQQAHCASCGDWIRMNPNARTRSGDPMPNEGWYHHDGMKRDHLARPHDERSADAQRTSDRARLDQARMHVKQRLNEQMLGMSVDAIFKGQ